MFRSFASITVALLALIAFSLRIKQVVKQKQWSWQMLVWGILEIPIVLFISRKRKPPSLTWWMKAIKIDARRAQYETNTTDLSLWVFIISFLLMFFLKPNFMFL